MLHRLLVLFAVFLLIIAAPAAAQETAFPVTIEHKFGTTVITEAPQRVVAIGFTEQDSLLALGTVPVAVRYWYGDESNAIFEWAQDEAGGAVPQVLNMTFGELNYEAILALQPDLISAVTSGITQEEYDLLSQIAPTIPQSGEYIDFGIPWQDTTLMIGEALGKTEEAEAAVAEVEGLFETARAENPEFEGKTVVVAYNTGATYGFYAAQDSRVRFFTELGFVMPDELNELAGDNFYVDISSERIDLLDQDLIVFLGLQFLEGGREALENDPLLNQLDAVREGRVLYVPAEVDDALQFTTGLSLPYALEGLLPEIRAALELEAETAAVTCEAGFRSIVDAIGESVCVPENPQRVMALMESDLDALLALDVTPIATTNGRGQSTPPRYLADYLGDMAVVGQFYAPNLERVLALQPDLILMGGFSNPDVLSQLNEIAPTINTFMAGESWQSHFTRVGEVMNLQEEAADFIAAYDERVEEISAALGENAGSEFIVARWSADGPQIMSPTTFSSRILMDIGLTPPAEIPQLQEGHPHSEPLSLEALNVLDVDWAFLGSLTADGSDFTALEEVVENPLFQALEVVQNDHVVFIDGSLWTSIGGPLAALAVLDDVEAALIAQE